MHARTCTHDYLDGEGEAWSSRALMTDTRDAKILPRSRFLLISYPIFPGIGSPGRASDQINSCSVSIPQAGTLAAALFYPCKIKLGTVRLSQYHTVARKFHLINSSGERRLDLNSVAVEDIPAPGTSDHDSPIFRKFPNHRVCILRHAPFTDDIVRRTPAAGNPTQQNPQNDYH